MSVTVNCHPKSIEVKILETPSLGQWPTICFRDGASYTTVHLSQDHILKLRDVLNHFISQEYPDHA